MNTSGSGLPVVLESVTKRYVLGDGSALVAARDVSFAVAAGKSVALTGTSGSGKSTLLHLIGAVDTPDGGTIRVGDVAVSELRGRSAADYRSTIWFVFQQYFLLPSLSLVDNVCAPLMGRRRGREVRGKAMVLLDSVGLADRAHALPSELSGGQQQRVAIARALIGDPGLLLADEPTGNLDSATAEDIMEVLEALESSLGLTMMIATHDAQLAAWCDRRLSVSDGRVREPPITDERSQSGPLARAHTEVVCVGGGLRYALGELGARLSRTILTLLASILAVSSFVVLTGTVERQRLDVTQLVEANARGAYDILVRPKGSTSDIEAAQQIVREDYLSGPSTTRPATPPCGRRPTPATSTSPGASSCARESCP